MKASVVAFALVLSSGPAWAQAVSLADLEGAVITVSAVYHEHIIRAGEHRMIELHTTGRITVSADKTISSQFQSSATNDANGRSRTGPGFSGSATLDRPRTGAQGNDTVWTFVNGSLVRLRVFSNGAGGQKMTVSFRRTGNGLSCSFAMPMAREVGVGRIHKGSAIDNAPIDILEFTPISSSCQVTKG
ncbi:MAG TPA: hypothetical protein VEK75_05760 [Xanthobacteraceae bacterium]|nr:hypothetical protein [Xanthobacteraceae bacterium]